MGDRINKTQKSPESLPLVSEQALLKVGDRMVTPTGRIGVIIPPDADMPNHHLVLFDDDRTFWMLREILQSGPVPDSKSGHTTKPGSGLDMWIRLVKPTFQSALWRQYPHV